MEAWKFGGLDAWRCHRGWSPGRRLCGDETERCAAITVQAQRAKPSTAKNTKNHKDTQSTTQGAGRACAQGVRPAREPVGAWRASHATLWGRGADAPTARVRRFRRCRRYRSAPAGRQQTVLLSGVSRRPICPIGPICPTASCYGTSQTCRGCRGSWKFGSLDAWKFGFSAQRLFCRALAARSVFCFLFSVLWGALAPLPLPGRGAAPHIHQSANQLISQFPLCPSCPL